MIVEDQALLAMEMESFLESAGLRVVGIADDFATAVEQVDATLPDLVLLDVPLLCGDSGFDVAAELRTRAIPCLFVTGNCAEIGGRDLALRCLHKPFGESTLTRAVAVTTSIIRGHAIGSLPSGLHLFLT